MGSLPWCAYPLVVTGGQARIPIDVGFTAPQKFGYQHFGNGFVFCRNDRLPLEGQVLGKQDSPKHLQHDPVCP